MFSESCQPRSPVFLSNYQPCPSVTSATYQPCAPVFLIKYQPCYNIPPANGWFIGICFPIILLANFVPKFVFRLQSV